MNERTDFLVILRIEAAAFAVVCREELLALLADYTVVAIHEDDAEPGIAWSVSFGEHAWQIMDDPSFDVPGLDDVDADGWRAVNPSSAAPLDVNWRRYPDLSVLVTADAGRAVTARFAESGVHCRLLAETGSWSLTKFEESHGRVHVGRIIVSPPWQFPDPDDTNIILKIKPSMGFGTGHHPSTRLALSLLQRIDCGGRDVLDVGTGSGLLAMAAARLGAARVCAIDRDPNALAAAAEGVRRNRLTNRVELRQADISTEAVGQYHLVIANLEAVQIQAWAHSLRRHVHRPGQLLVSGFLTAEAEFVLRTLREPALLIEYEDDWAAVVINLPAA
jgi:ribosomal protein L11 methyltransferase